jgi:hypothetical protein
MHYLMAGLYQVEAEKWTTRRKEKPHLCLRKDGALEVWNSWSRVLIRERIGAHLDVID